METVSRRPKCARCRNHGFVVTLKGHAGRCRFSQCSCWKCALISERASIMARHRGARKRQRDSCAPGTRTGAAPEVSRGDTDPASGLREPGTDTDTEDRTYTELEIPVPGSSGTWAPSTEPESPQKSLDYCKGTQDYGTLREQPHLPWENLVPEIPQNAVYPGDVAMAMPLHLHTHCVPPAFLFGFGAPPFGFPHIPQAALMESRQESPGLFYTPYLFHLKPDHYQQYISERAHEADVSPVQQEQLKADREERLDL